VPTDERSHSRVEPSTSANSSVTVPVGKSPLTPRSLQEPVSAPNQFPLDPLATLMFPKVFPSSMKMAPGESSEGHFR
jgi:hypothetical protein